MLYITIQENKITGIHCAENDVDLKQMYPNSKVQEVPESFSGFEGEDIETFDSDFNRIITTYKYYIRYDDKNRITKIISDKSDELLNTDIFLEENTNPNFTIDLYDDDRNLKYKYEHDDNKFVERSIEEIQEDDEYKQRQLDKIAKEKADKLALITLTAKTTILSAFPLEKQMSYKNDFDFAVVAIAVTKKVTVQDIQYTILTWLSDKNNDLEILKNIDKQNFKELYSLFSIANEDIESQNYIQDILKGIIIYRLILSVRNWSNEQETFGEIKSSPPVII
jgi:hypothetical protein